MVDRRDATPSGIELQSSDFEADLSIVPRPFAGRLGAPGPDAGALLNPVARPVVRPLSQTSPWRSLQQRTSTLTPQPQTGLATLSPPEVSLVTLPLAELEQTLLDSGSFSGLKTLLEAGVNSGALLIRGERLLLNRPGSPGEPPSRPFDLTATLRSVAQRFWEEETPAGPGQQSPDAHTPPPPSDTVSGLLRQLLHQSPEKPLTSHREQPIVSIPGSSPNLVRHRSAAFSTGSLPLPDARPLQEPMPVLTQRSPIRPVQNRQGPSTPRTQRANAVTSRGGRPTLPPGPTANTGSSPPLTPSQKAPPVAAPGRKMMVESTLQELARVVRQERRWEQEDDHDRTF